MSSSSDSSDSGREPDVAQVAKALNNPRKPLPNNPRPSNPLQIRQASTNEFEGSPLDLPLELLGGIFRGMESQNALFQFSQIEKSARDAVIWHLETEFLKNRLEASPDEKHEVFSIAVAAFPPKKFCADINVRTIQDMKLLTPKSHADERDPILEKPVLQKYLMFLCNQILVAQNVCSYVEDEAAKNRSFALPHRPYVKNMDRVPKKTRSRSLKSMMMLWYCLITVKDSIEEKRLARPTRPLTSDWLKEEVSAFVEMVAGPDHEKTALITILRGFYFVEPLIEVVRQDRRILRLGNFKPLNGHEAAWTCNLLYQGLSRLLEVLSQDEELEKALNGGLLDVESARCVKTDTWEGYIRDAVYLDVFGDIRNTGEAHITAPSRSY